MRRIREWLGRSRVARVALAVPAVGIALTAAQVVAPAGSALAPESAEAACPSIAYLHVTVPMYINGEPEWVESQTKVVVCSGGYYRLQEHKFFASNGIAGIYASPDYGRPSVYWFTGGTGHAVNGIDAYTYWNRGMTTALGNQICEKACGVEFDGRPDAIGLPSSFEQPFHTLKWFTG
jgi:hypothetical protein